MLFLEWDFVEVKCLNKLEKLLHLLVVHLVIVTATLNVFFKSCIVGVFMTVAQGLRC